jgi:hypothetical protein
MFRQWIRWFLGLLTPPRRAARRRPARRLGVEFLEGRAVPSHGLGHGADDATPPALVSTPTVTTDTELHAPELVDAQRGYPVPPTTVTKPKDDVVLNPRPVIVLPPMTAEPKTPTDPVVVANPTPAPAN